MKPDSASRGRVKRFSPISMRIASSAAARNASAPAISRRREMRSASSPAGIANRMNGNVSAVCSRPAKPPASRQGRLWNHRPRCTCKLVAIITKIGQSAQMDARSPADSAPEPVPGADGWRADAAADAQRSLPEMYGTISVPRAGHWSRRLLAFIGPGYLVSVGYMDPGNWATDLAGGSKFGYTLLSVILLSNLMAILLQALAARLGIASGRDLAQACRQSYPRPVGYLLWAACELAIIACDLAEVIGTAIALKLLFGIPLIGGALITALDAFLVLM